MLIDEIYTDVRNFSNNSQLSGYIPINQFNEYSNFAQMAIIDEMYEILDYNMLSSILIADVLKTANVEVVNGIVQKPTDFYKYVDSSALYFEDGNFEVYPIDFISTSERNERLRSKIVEPTLKHPIATEGFSGIRLDPKEISRVELTYLFKPPAPEWVGTDTVPPIFSPTLSTDFVLSDKFKTILTYKICSYFSIEIRDGELSAVTTKQLIQQP